MTLVCFQFAMIGKLYVDRATSDLWRIDIEASDDCGGRCLVCHFQKCLIFTLQHKHICYPTKWYAQLYDFTFARLIWYVPDVYYSGRFTYGSCSIAKWKNNEKCIRWIIIIYQSGSVGVHVACGKCICRIALDQEPTTAAVIVEWIHW